VGVSAGGAGVPAVRGGYFDAQTGSGGSGDVLVSWLSAFGILANIVAFASATTEIIEE